MSYDITLQNKRIYEFYEQHKNLDIEDMNIILIEILEKLYKDSETTLNASVSRQLLDNVKSLQTQMNTFSDSFTKIQNEVNMNFILKFTEFKKEYMEDIKMIINSNTSDKIAPLFEKYNETLQDKTKILINDIIPRSQESTKKDIIDFMRTLQESIVKDFENFSHQQINSDTLNNFITTIDDKFSKTLVNTQGVLSSIVSSTENRITTQIGEIKNISTLNSTTQNQVYNNLNEMLKKMENSSVKGKISENLLLGVIQSLYPIAQIDTVAGTKETGDIMLTRRDKTTVLFENKNYDINVGKSEIDKFYRDIDVQNCNGILLSQKTAIVNKNNYEIEIYNGKIVIFLHNVNYDPDKIKTAVDIIDHFQELLSETSNNMGDSEIVELSKEKLEEINLEYNSFVLNKLNLIKTLKEYNQKVLLQVENFKMPSLEIILNKNFSNSLAANKEVCEYCGYKAKNSRALIAHLRACGENKERKNNLKNNGLENTIQPSNTVSVTPIVPPSSVKTKK